MPKCILTEQVKSSTSEDIILQSIAVTTPPTKTIYSPGEAFDPSGMVVTGTYYVSTSEITITAEITSYSYSPSVITTGTTSVTISYSEGNHTATTTQAVAIWEWGSETATADTNWFKGLQAIVQVGGADSSWVGKTKSVTLTSAVLGTTTHLIRCIGVNQDGNNTVTFQTANCLANTTTFGSSAVWIGSTARTQCQNYYNAFPGKSYIKTVSKGTCPSTNDDHNGTPTYNNETVWLPSEREMGLNHYAPISTGFSSTNRAECTKGYNESYAYYNSNANRIKKNGDSGSAYSYWERSRHSESSYSNYACVVDSTGQAFFNGYNVTSRLAPAFVIG